MFVSDEVQHITVKGCNSGLTISSRTFQLKMMDRFFVPQNVSLLCDASNAVIRSTILAATSLDVHVAVKTTSAVGDPLIIQVIFP